jgi:hypothetical protein
MNDTKKAPEGAFLMKIRRVLSFHFCGIDDELGEAFIG